MDATHNPTAEVVLPATVFSALRRAVGEAAGDLQMIHAFHAAGFAAGKEVAPLVRTAVGGGPASVPEATFWRRFSQFFVRRGWGACTHERGSDAIGILSSRSWAESGGGEGSEGCSFSSGFLSAILSDIAGGPIAVLETSCRGRGDAECRFAFGSESAVHEMYGALVEGVEFTDVLASL